MEDELGRVSTVEALVRAIRTRLLEGDLPPGTHLQETQLAERYGVGRHSLRAALARLTQEGLLRHEPNRGAFVPEPDLEVLADLHELRTALELRGLELALERGGSLAEAEAAQARLAALPDGAPWSEILVAHNDLHRGLVDAAGSARISAAYAALQSELLLYLVHLRPFYTLPEMVELHRRLLDEIASGDRERALAALRRDLRGSQRAAGRRNRRSLRSRAEA